MASPHRLRKHRRFEAPAVGLAWAALAGAAEALPSELVVASGPGCAGTQESLGRGLLSREWEDFRRRREPVPMTSSCHQLSVSKDKADVSSYLQSFFLFPAKRPFCWDSTWQPAPCGLAKAQLHQRAFLSHPRGGVRGCPRMCHHRATCWVGAWEAPPPAPAPKAAPRLLLSQRVSSSHPSRWGPCWAGLAMKRSR